MFVSIHHDKIAITFCIGSLLEKSKNFKSNDTIKEDKKKNTIQAYHKHSH